LVKRSLLAAV